jgi:sugar/nucleoside kinase (ribokinase family)
MFLREGFACAGNWIIERRHLIDHYPAEEQLAFIQHESKIIDGCAYNVISDLRAIDPDLPLYAIGVVGEDEDGHFILNACHQRDIDTFQLVASSEAPTAHAEVMLSRANCRRTLFYHPGANSLLDLEHFDFDHCWAKWLHLGCWMRLEKLNQPDAEFGAHAGRVLHLAKEAGLVTSVNLVTTESDAHPRVIVPVLPQVDYLVINEIAAEQTSGIRTRHDGELLKEGIAAAARKLLQAGVNGAVAIHFPEGGYVAVNEEMPIGASAASTNYWQGSLVLPPENILNSAGAGGGAAFCAGFIYGCYSVWPVQKCLQMAVCCAAANLCLPTSNGGIMIKEANLNLLNKFPCRDLS